MEKKKSFLLGIVGSLIGGLIATIPWIIFYVYANMIYSLLAIIVAMGALKGYELFKGKVDNKLPWIIGIVSLICITIATLIIIPNLLLIKEYGTTSLANFKLLYETTEFKAAIIKDYIISLLFTFLGISGVISSIRYQVKNGSEKIDLNYNKNKVSDERIEEIKETFVKLNAIDKTSAIPKDILISNIDIDDLEIMYLIQSNYIKKYKKNYYFDTKENKKTSKKRTYIIWIVCIVIIFTVGILSNIGSKDNNYKDNNKDVTYSISSNYQEYKNETEKDGWYYVPKKDLSGESGIIDIIVLKKDFESNSNKETKELFDEMMENYYKVTKKSGYKSKNGYYTLEYTLDFDDYYEYVYYLFNGNEYAIIDGINYTAKPNQDIISSTKKIADTFEWKK